MTPPRDSSADTTQTPAAIAAVIAAFLEAHPEAAVLEDGRVAFDLSTAKHEVTTTETRCTLHLWSEEANTVRRVLSVVERNGTLRLSTQRFGQTQPKLLEMVASRVTRTPTTRDTARTRYLRVLERVLQREFPEYKTDAFRTSMDLEESFGPAYARGSLRQGKQAFAVIGVSDAETAVTMDGILTPGILWLHHCREHAQGRWLYQGLKVVVPRGMAQLTLARLAWMNPEAAQWQLYELDVATEELVERDVADQGNVRSRLVHHPDEAAAQERFADAIADVRLLVPEHEYGRVEQRLRSTSEMAFLLHGLEFARARVGMSPDSFAQTLELTVGAAPNETPFTGANRQGLRQMLAELFERRRAFVPLQDFGRRASTQHIGSKARTQAAHSRLNIASAPRGQFQNPTQDPLYRAVPERWLESVLRANLAPLTRSLGPQPMHSMNTEKYTTIPRLNPQYVYSQVPAIAGASDRGLLDLLGVTADGRLAVIELKADDDLNFALQGLDYWIRVRHHHAQPMGDDGKSDFQRHGYFCGLQLSPLAPRLYLVAPALHIHPATETILRYLSPRVEWHFLALDERWRQQIRVVWRKQSFG